MEIDFVVLPNLSFEFVIGRRILKPLGGALDFKDEEVRFEYRNQSAVLSMVRKHAR